MPTLVLYAWLFVLCIGLQRAGGSSCSHANSSQFLLDFKLHSYWYHCYGSSWLCWHTARGQYKCIAMYIDCDTHSEAVWYWSRYFSLFLSHSVQKCSTTPSGTRLLTPCLWCLQLSILWQGLLFFHSGKHVKSTDATACITGIICKCIMCAYLLQADPLYMGVPTGAICPLLWLLLLQCHAVGSTDTPPLLGFSHFTNGL